MMKRALQILAGLAIGLGLFWLLFRNTNWEEVAAAIRNTRPGWLLLALAVSILSHFARVQRWSYIVRTAGPVPFRPMFSATQIGFLANFTLPGRVGELVRALVLRRLARLPFAKCLAMAALDRVADLISLAVVMVVVVFAYTPTGTIVLPQETFGREIRFDADTVRHGEAVVFLVLSASIGGLVLLYVKQSLLIRMAGACAGLFSQRLAERLQRLLQDFAGGLHVFRSASDMAKSIFYSLVTWGLLLVTIALFLKSFGIEAPWYTAFMVQALMAVVGSVPGAPGFIGQFHVPFVIALLMAAPDVDVSKAKAAALVAHLLALGPVVVLGVFCLFWERLGFVELIRASGQTGVEQQEEIPDQS